MNTYYRSAAVTLTACAASLSLTACTAGTVDGQHGRDEPRGS
jgi:hypothetical protein